MDVEQAKKVFPIYKDESGCIIFDESHLPPQAKQQEIEIAYRVCRNGIINRDSFKATYEEEFHLKDLDIKNYKTFSTSCFYKLRDAKGILKCSQNYNPNPILAYGKIPFDSGYSLIDKDIEPKCKKSHINWWIFADEHPEQYFEEFKESGV